MSMTPKAAKATLIFETRPRLDFSLLAESLKRPLRNVDVEFDEIELDQDDYVLFDSEDLTLRVGWNRVPVLQANLQKAGRPQKTQSRVADISPLLTNYTHSLEVSVGDGLLGSSKDSTKLSICYQIVRHILRKLDVRLVQWHATDVLFTVEEFENPAELQLSKRPQRPISVEPNPVVAQQAMSASATVHAQGVADDYDDTRASGRWASVFPDISEPDAPPAQPTPKRTLKERFAKLVKMQDLRLDAPLKPARLAEQLTVYVMSVTLMVLAFPVGFAMLIYNILGGEDLRNTSRVMALTGTVMALGMVGLLPDVSHFV